MLSPACELLCLVVLCLVLLHLRRHGTLSCAPASQPGAGKHAAIRHFYLWDRHVLDRITETAKASNLERSEAGYESMAHFTVNTDDAADMLRAINFHTVSLGDNGEDGCDLDEVADDQACLPDMGGEPGKC